MIKALIMKMIKRPWKTDFTPWPKGRVLLRLTFGIIKATSDCNRDPTNMTLKIILMEKRSMTHPKPNTMEMKAMEPQSRVRP